MIPFIKDGVGKIFGTHYVIEEFRTGHGIADLVCTSQISQRPTLRNFSLINTLLEKTDLINKYLMGVTIGDYPKKELKIIEKYLDGLGLLSSTLCGKKYINGEYKPCTTELISIEAKLKDWKGGLIQANRYKKYSHYSYLAIAEPFIHRVDKSELKKSNIGLLSVSSKGIKILVKPRKKLPENRTAYYYNSELFAHHLHAM